MQSDVSHGDMAAIQAAKRALRPSLRARLRDVSSEDLARQSALVTERALASDSYRNATRISVYLSTPSSEVQTDALIRRKAVFAPYCPPDSGRVMHMLRLRPGQLESLAPKRWGIREPEPTAENALDGDGLDLVFAPGLAFDRQRNRLGHGRGYYDAFVTLLERFRADRGLSPPAVIALALDNQILPEGELLPTTSWDRKPDAVLSPSLALQ